MVAFAIPFVIGPLKVSTLPVPCSTMVRPMEMVVALVPLKVRLFEPTNVNGDNVAGALLGTATALPLVLSMVTPPVPIVKEFAPSAPALLMLS